MLKTVFSVEIGEKDSKNYIYGTTIYSQMLFMNVLKNGIDLQGYVMEYNESEVSPEFKNLYNQKVFKLTELRKYNESNNSKVNIIGIALDDTEIDFIKSQGYNLIILTVPECVVIYGMGNNCLKTKEILEMCGCKILAVTDSYPERTCLTEEDRKGIKIIKKEELIRDYRSECIVVSVVNREARKQIEDWLIENCIEKISCMENEILYIDVEDKTYSFFLTQFFPNQYLYYNANRSFLYGSISWLLAVDYFIKLCHIPITVGYISEEGFIGEYKGVSFISIYDLLTEDYGEYKVRVNDNINTILKAREQVSQLGLEEKRFSIGNNDWKLFHNTILDARLILMNDKKGYVLHKKTNGKRNLRIGILGESTSDPGFGSFTSWPKYLLDILETNGIDAEIYNTAFSSHTVEDELLNFTRYLLPLELDIIISYGGWNDMHVRGDYSTYFVNILFEKTIAALEKEKTGDFRLILSAIEHLKAKKNQKNIDFMEEKFDHAKHWVDIQQTMHAICKERGIRYIGILHPSILSKESLTPMASQWLALQLVKANRENIYMRMHKLWNELVENTSWAYDFTGIFDNIEEEIFIDACHVTEVGNKIVAEKIAEVLLK